MGPGRVQVTTWAGLRATRGPMAVAVGSQLPLGFFGNFTDADRFPVVPTAPPRLAARRQTPTPPTRDVPWRTARPQSAPARRLRSTWGGPAQHRRLAAPDDQARLPQPATSTAISADSSTVLTGGADHSIRVWDLLGDARTPGAGLPRPSWARTTVLEEHRAEVLCTASSLNGTRRVSADALGVVLVWEVGPRRTFVSSEPVQLGPHDGPVHSCALSADGSQVVTVGVVGDSVRATVAVWDTCTKEGCVPFSTSERAYTSCAISADGALVAAGAADGTLWLWARTASTTGAAPVSSLRGHSATITSCALSADGACLVSASADMTLRVWDLDVTRQRETLVLRGHSQGVTCCSVSADGSTAVSGSADSTVMVWPLSEFYDDRIERPCRPAPKVLTGHTGMIRSVALDVDGNSIVSVGAKDRCVMVWDLDPARADNRRLAQARHIAQGTLKQRGKSTAVLPQGARALSKQIEEMRQRKCDLRMHNAAEENAQKLRQRQLAQRRRQFSQFTFRPKINARRDRKPLVSKSAAAQEPASATPESAFDRDQNREPEPEPEQGSTAPESMIELETSTPEFAGADHADGRQTRQALEDEFALVLQSNPGESDQENQMMRQQLEEVPADSEAPICESPRLPGNFRPGESDGVDLELITLPDEQQPDVAVLQSATKVELLAEVVRLRAQVQHLLSAETRQNELTDSQHSDAVEESAVSSKAAGQRSASAASAGVGIPESALQLERETPARWIQLTVGGNEWANAASLDMAKREWLYLLRPIYMEHLYVPGSICM